MLLLARSRPEQKARRRGGLTLQEMNILDSMPILILPRFFQRYIIHGLMAGWVKS